MQIDDVKLASMIFGKAGRSATSDNRSAAITAVRIALVRATLECAAVHHKKQGCAFAAAAQDGLNRSPVVPDVPTMAKTLLGFQAVPWYTLLALRGTRPAIVARLNNSM